MRLIDADALIESFWDEVENGNQLGYGDTEELIRNAPTIEAEPVKHGRWSFDDAEMEYYCSECWHNAPIGMSSYILHKNYPACGAKMDLEESK